MTVRTLSPAEVEPALDKGGCALVDIRIPDEFAQGVELGMGLSLLLRAVS